MGGAGVIATEYDFFVLQSFFPGPLSQHAALLQDCMRVFIFPHRTHLHGDVSTSTLHTRNWWHECVGMVGLHIPVTLKPAPNRSFSKYRVSLYISVYRQVTGTSGVYFTERLVGYLGEKLLTCVGSVVVVAVVPIRSYLSLSCMVSLAVHRYVNMWYI